MRLICVYITHKHYVGFPKTAAAFQKLSKGVWKVVCGGSRLFKVGKSWKWKDAERAV